MTEESTNWLRMEVKCLYVYWNNKPLKTVGSFSANVSCPENNMKYHPSFAVDDVWVSK